MGVISQCGVILQGPCILECQLGSLLLLFRLALGFFSFVIIVITLVSGPCPVMGRLTHGYVYRGQTLVLVDPMW